MRSVAIEISRFFGDYLFVTFVRHSFRRSYIVRSGSPSHLRVMRLISVRADRLRDSVQLPIPF